MKLDCVSRALKDPCLSLSDSGQFLRKAIGKYSNMKARLGTHSSLQKSSRINYAADKGQSERSVCTVIEQKSIAHLLNKDSFGAEDEHTIEKIMFAQHLRKQYETVRMTKQLRYLYSRYVRLTSDMDKLNFHLLFMPLTVVGRVRFKVTMRLSYFTTLSQYWNINDISNIARNE